MSKVFLGGTCGNSPWRERLISMLNIDYFNPVVRDWTSECQEEELRQRELCDYCLYTITPSMRGVYSIAEVIDDSNKRPEKTVFCVLAEEVPFNAENPFKPSRKICFSVGERKSLEAVGMMVRRNGGIYLKSLEDVALYLNKEARL